MKVLNKHTDAIPIDAVYVGRGSPYGNPFILGRDGDRNEVCDKYKVWFDSQTELKERALKELRGKSLVCFCAPLRCHADYLMKVSNE